MDVVTPPEAPAANAARRLWQAPVFVLGVVALFAAWCARPYLGGGPCVVHELAEARRDLDGGRADPAAIADLLHRLLDRGVVPADRAGEARFLYGTALSRLAERTSPALARDF